MYATCSGKHIGSVRNALMPFSHSARAASILATSAFTSPSSSSLRLREGMWSYHSTVTSSGPLEMYEL